MESSDFCRKMETGGQVKIDCQSLNRKYLKWKKRREEMRRQSRSWKDREREKTGKAALFIGSHAKLDVSR